MVSVPFRGLFYLNASQRGLKSLYQTSFRPLPGTLLSKCSNGVIGNFLYNVSVPFRGLFYLNEIDGTIKDFGLSFRPLPGTLLSKYHEPIFSAGANFFTHLRGK